MNSGIHEYFRQENKHASIDIETLGTSAGSIIWEIAACLFNPITGQACALFHCPIDIDASQKESFTSDHLTQEFWIRRGGIPSKKEPSEIISPRAALEQLEKWLQKHTPSYIWARGADFEINLIGAYCDHYDVAFPWKYYQTRDTRTIWDCAFPDQRPANDVHRALPDAIAQAEQTALALRTLIPLPTSLRLHRPTLPNHL